MDFVNINPGIKAGLRQAFTITVAGQIFFLTHYAPNDKIEWNMFIDDDAMRQRVEEILKSYLTNQ